jgi:hypothetical protein
MATNDGQKRAAAGGEFGPNGEWYKGGAWIATTEEPKGVPVERVLSPEAAARHAEQAARAARIAAWVEARRVRFADLIATLTFNPGDVDDATWRYRVENHSAGFLPSLGRSLYTGGSLTERQAEYAVKAVLGRRTKKNADEWESLRDALCEDYTDEGSN